MLFLPEGVRVHLCTRPADMRKSFDGLCGLTRTVIGANPQCGHLFVFMNRRRDYVKILYWSYGGFCLWAKRLEQGRFAMPDVGGVAVTLSATELAMWLDGIEAAPVRRRRFALPEQTAIMAA